jgi:hypothetical protein
VESIPNRTWRFYGTSLSDDLKFSTMTFSTMTFSIMTFSIMTFSIMTLGIVSSIVTLSNLYREIGCLLHPDVNQNDVIQE